MCARCRKNGKPAFVEGEKERERVEGWLDEGGWDDRRWRERSEKEGRRGKKGDGSETGESWTGKKQKCIAARWPSTERLSRLRASIGENGDTESAVYGICVPASTAFPKLHPGARYLFREYDECGDAYGEEEIVTLKNSNLKKGKLVAL